MCNAIEIFPNATVKEFGRVHGAKHMKAEIFHRGPIACGINANKILDYKGGLVDVPDAGREIDHIVSVTGWGYDADAGLGCADCGGGLHGAWGVGGMWCWGWRWVARCGVVGCFVGARPA